MPNQVPKLSPEETRWHEKLVDLAHQANEQNLKATFIVGSFVGAAVAAAKRGGATLDNLIQLIRTSWGK